MAHARERAKLRYGIDLTPELHRLLVQRIRGGEAKLIREHPRKYDHGSNDGRCLVYELEHEGVLLHVVFDEKTQCLVTFLYTDPTRYLYEMCGY
jgi:hypothetical protein